jgi:hypothetical protein
MAALPTRTTRDYGAEPANLPEKKDDLVGPAARGGLVADWQRRIEERFGDPMARLEESHGDALLRQISRAAGYGALAAGYLTIGWLIFG